MNGILFFFPRKKKLALSTSLTQRASADSKQSVKPTSGKSPSPPKSIGRLGFQPNVGPQWVDPSPRLFPVWIKAHSDFPQAQLRTFFTTGLDVISVGPLLSPKTSMDLDPFPSPQPKPSSFSTSSTTTIPLSIISFSLLNNSMEKQTPQVDPPSSQLIISPSYLGTSHIPC